MCKFEHVKRAINKGKIAMMAERIDMAEAFGWGTGEESYIDGLNLRMELTATTCAELSLYVNLCDGKVYAWEVRGCRLGYIHNVDGLLLTGPVDESEPLYRAIADVVNNELIQRTIDHGEV